MDIKSVTVSFNPEELSDEQLISVSQEIAQAAEEIAQAAEARGLEIPSVAGSVAVEGAMQEPEADSEPFTPETAESLSEQLTSASAGYTGVVEALNKGKRKNSRIEVADAKTLASEFNAWLTEDKLDYINEAMEADPTLTFTLVATPNVLADSKDIVKAAKAFGDDQPYETYVWDKIYGKYTAQKLSGTDPDNGNSVSFSLIPSNFTPEMEGTVADQRDKLAKLQEDNPDLKVPSVLDAVTYWSTLRAESGQLTGYGIFDKTYIRHFDLDEQPIDNWSYLPYFFVRGYGEAYLDGSYAGVGNDGRVSVG